MNYPLHRTDGLPDDANPEFSGSGSPRLVAVAPATPSAAAHGTCGVDTPPTITKTMLDLEVDQEAENIKSYLAVGDIINGDLEVRGGARIDGHVRGSLVCRDGSAIVSDTGVVDGSVVASRRIIVDGKIGQGEKAVGSEVNCPGDVIVLGNGVVQATVSYGNLVTYDGGQITGKISRHAKR